MEEAQKDNTDNMIDILMLLIKANMSFSKNMSNGVLLRDIWITICQKLNQFLEVIETQKKLKNEKSKSKDQEEVDDFDKYDAMMKD
jgi:flagellar biosynthesis chaperone FliJ